MLRHYTWLLLFVAIQLLSAQIVYDANRLEVIASVFCGYIVGALIERERFNG